MTHASSLCCLRKHIPSRPRLSMAHRQRVGCEPGYFKQTLRVYDRETQPCHTCGTPIKRIVQTNRSTFYCPKCQK